MSNIVMVAGKTLDIDSLPLYGQLEFIEFFNFLKNKFYQEEKLKPTISSQSKNLKDEIMK